MIPPLHSKWRRDWNNPAAPIYTITAFDGHFITYSFKSQSTSRTRRGRYRNSVQHHVETIDLQTWSECFSPGDQIITPIDPKL